MYNCKNVQMYLHIFFNFREASSQLADPLIYLYFHLFSDFAKNILAIALSCFKLIFFFKPEYEVGKLSYEVRLIPGMSVKFSRRCDMLQPDFWGVLPMFANMVSVPMFF